MPQLVINLPDFDRDYYTACPPDSQDRQDSIQAAACDEIFFHQQQVLTIVKPDAMAIGAIKKTSVGVIDSFRGFRYGHI